MATWSNSLACSTVVHGQLAALVVKISCVRLALGVAVAMEACSCVQFASYSVVPINTWRKVIGGNSGRGVTPDTSTSIGYSFRCERPHCFELAQLVLQGMHEKLEKSCSRTIAIQPRTADFPQLTGSNYEPKLSAQHVLGSLPLQSSFLTLQSSYQT